jgi:16S rRNA (guanine966-N2)-methyltransferase
MSVVTPELPGARVLDLFAGSGALGIEALSRGASHATFVESSPAALRVLNENLDQLAVDRSAVRVVRADVLRYLESTETLRFDVAFADPPYRQGYPQQLAERYVKAPFAHLLGIEHERGEPLGDINPTRQKRYGDTVLTFLTPDDAA